MLENKLAALLSPLLDRLKPFTELPFQVRVMRTELVEDSAINIIQEVQLAQGEDSNGDDLGSYASLSYKGRYRPVDLHDTGDFYRRMYASVTAGGTFYTSSTDRKNEKLERKYGKDIHGVAVKNFPEWFPDIRLAYATEVRKALR